MVEDWCCASSALEDVTLVRMLLVVWQGRLELAAEKASMQPELAAVPLQLQQR